MSQKVTVEDIVNVDRYKELLDKVSNGKATREERTKFHELGLLIMKKGRKLMIEAESDTRYSLARAVEIAVNKLYERRESSVSSPPVGSDNALAWFRGKMIANEGLIGAGKTKHTNAVVESLRKKGINAHSFDEPVPSAPLTKYYANPDLEAYASQLLFAALRSGSNEAAQAFAGRFPTEYPVRDPNDVGCAMGDRTCIGDVMFAILVLLMGFMLMSEFDAVLETYSKRFAFSAILFMDVSASRAEWVCKNIRCRPNEMEIPLNYFENLRLMHYAVMRALALRGAPVLYTYCDDKPMSKNNIAFLDAEATIKALMCCPEGDEVKALWADTAEPVFGVTTEDDVSAELAKVRQRYARYSNEHVRGVAHVRVTSSA